jgi:hypothetical protein
MKPVIIIFALFLWSPTVTFGQVKIGDNPQNINPSSLLELESSSRVLVITRVSTLDMEAILPQRGGIVYNTDTECMHYYNGTNWINLCDAVSFSLTNDPIENIASTISIVDNGGTINLEVAQNSIRSENIVDGGINGDDIQDNSIGESKLGNDSVSANELRDNSVGTSELADGSILPTDIANTLPEQVLITDEFGVVQWGDASNLTIEVALDIAENAMDIADHIFEDADTDNQNETLTSAVLDGNDLVLIESGLERRVALGIFNNPGTDNQNILGGAVDGNTLRIDVEGGNSGTIDVSSLTGTGTDNQTLNLNGNLLEITGGNNVNLVGYLDNTDEQELTIVGTRISLTDGGFVDLPAGTVDTDEQQLTIAGTRISLTDGGFVDLPAGTVDTDEQDLTIAGTTLNITNGVGVDLSPILGDTNTDNQNLGLAGNTLNISGGTGVDLTPILGGVNTDEQNLSLVGTTLNITDGTGVDLAPILGEANTDEQNLSLAGNTLNITNGTGVDLTPILGGVNTDEQNAAQVPFTPYITLSGPSTQFAIQQLKDELDAATLTGGGENPNNELQDIQLAGTIVSLTIPATTGNQIDLDPTFVSEVEFANLTITESQITDLAHTVDTQIDAAGITGLGFATGAHTINTDNQNATEVVYDNTASGLTGATTQAAIDELKTDIDGITADGEVNTASNQGNAGVATFIQKNGVDLEFRSINAASNKVIVTNDAVNNEVDIDVVDANLAITESQITDLAHTVDTQIDAAGIIGLGFATGPHTVNTDNQNAAAVPFAPTGNIASADVQAAIVELQTDIDGISAGGEVNTASNQGNAGVATFIQKNGVDLAFRSINAASNKVIVTNDAANNEVDIDVVDANLAITESQITDLAHTVDTQLDAAGIVGLGFAAGAHTLNTDEQNAAAVPFAPTGNTASADVQAAIVELQTDIDGISAGENLANTNLVQNANRAFDLNENNLTFDISNAVVAFVGTNSNFGIGMTNPQDKLDVDGQIRARNGFASTEGSAGNPGYGFYTSGDTDIGMFRIAADQLGFSTNGIEALRIDASRNVGIGPTFAGGTAIATRLHVDGNIRSEGTIEASGTITESIPDYVFQKYFKGNSLSNEDYQFENLQEIEKYVKENNHLPGIKSAAEIQQQGFWNLGEASRVNLEKIEELFLHTIEQEKKIKALENTNSTMAKEVKLLKVQMEEIKKMLTVKNNH